MGVRDIPSLRRARELAPHVNSQLTFDLAPLLLALDVRPRRRQPVEGLGVVLRGLATTSAGGQLRETRRLESIASAIKQLFASGLIDNVVLLDFSRERSCIDSLLHDRLSRLLPKHLPVRRVRYTSDPLTMLSEISRLQALLAMRLHASVFGYLTGVPSVTLSYHEKCTAWCAMIGQDRALVLEAEEAGSTDLARALRAALLGSAAPPSVTISDAFDRALSNWTWHMEPSAATAARATFVNRFAPGMPRACSAAD